MTLMKTLLGAAATLALTAGMAALALVLPGTAALAQSGVRTEGDIASAQNAYEAEVPVNRISSWVMPEKYQKNRNSQPKPAQSNPFAGVLLRLNIAIQRSS